MAEGGYKYNVALIAAMAALADVGPGSPVGRLGRLPAAQGQPLGARQFAVSAAGAALLTSERMNPEPAPDDAGVQAERQNRFAREDAEVPAR